MENKKNEIIEEIQSYISGKTLDAIFPPLLFALINHFLGLKFAVFIAFFLAGILGLLRILQKQNWLYALGGSLGVAVSSGLAYLTNSAVNYFIGSILVNLLWLLITLASLFVGKPIAAWASHLSRGWPLAWYWRRDIKPAYIEVTWLWSLFFFVRLAILFLLWQDGDTLTLAWTNILLGWPAMFIVLIASYIFGIWRLRQLDGPGIDEFKAKKNPPWKGQIKGF